MKEDCKFNYKYIVAAIVIAAVVLAVLFFVKGCGKDTDVEPAPQIVYEERKPEEEKIPVEPVEQLPLFPEMKSPVFKSDRAVFVDEKEAENWFSEQAFKIIETYRNHPEFKLKISGYVADFANEIDDYRLAFSRAEMVKKGLAEKGVPESIMHTVSMGKTSRWGNDKAENRHAAVESVSDDAVYGLRLISETKSPVFRSDRRDFVSSSDAEDWFVSQAEKITGILENHPELRINICGYVADFANEVDDYKLSLERARNVKKGLVRNGVPEKIIAVISMGKTSRWGEDRALNRFATIESLN